MTITEVKPLITACHMADDTLLMVGVHGIGKSQVVEQWARENDAHLEILFLAQQEISDLIGMPRTVEKDGEVITIWTTPIWLQRLNQASAAGKETVLFLDEISRAPLDVRQGALQLVLERRIHQHTLPKTGTRRTMIIAADNPDNGQYQSDTLDPALLDRFLTVTVEPDVESWLKFARETNVSPIIRDFIAENPTRLHFMPEDGGLETISASPRSWVKLSDHLKNFDNVPESAHYSIIKGKIGTAIGSQFYQFMNTYTKVIKMEDIEKVAKAAWKKTKDINDTAKYVEELTENLEAVQKSEMLLNLADKYLVPETKKSEDAIPFLAMLYSVPMETLAGFLKPLASSTKANEKEMYKKIVEIDFNKAIFRKIVDKKVD